MNNKSFFAGLEEVLSRLVSLVVCISFFAIFVVAKPDQTINLNAKDLGIWLLVFWFVYECIGFLLYSLFVYFGKNKEVKQASTNSFKIKDDINDTHL
jgi:hypothetical protein